MSCNPITSDFDCLKAIRVSTKEIVIIVALLAITILADLGKLNHFIGTTNASYLSYAGCTAIAAVFFIRVAINCCCGKINYPKQPLEKEIENLKQPDSGINSTSISYTNYPNKLSEKEIENLKLEAITAAKKFDQRCELYRNKEGSNNIPREGLYLKCLNFIINSTLFQNYPVNYVKKWNDFVKKTKSISLNICNEEAEKFFKLQINKIKPGHNLID